MNFFMTHRSVGKSVFGVMAAQLAQPSITVLDQTPVDGDQWYTLDVDPAVAAWIRQQPQEHWYEHSSNRFRPIMEVHEHLYTMMLLQWTSSDHLT